MTQSLKPVEVSPSEAREWTVEADFVNAIREGKRAVEPSFWDGLKYMEMTEAIFLSCAQNRTVDLPFDDLLRDDGGAPALDLSRIPPLPAILQDIGHQGSEAV